MSVVESPACAQLASLRAGELSARELLEAHLERIERANPLVNAVVAFAPDMARERAAAVDACRAGGVDPGPVGGLVMAHKDLVDVAGLPTSMGSPAMAGYLPTNDSPLVAALRRAGAVCVGKTNVPEFGAGSNTFNPVYGTTRNPADPERTVGGSSGGAAAALATGMVALADGSDLGGSLRNPAAWCGVVGLRPTVGVVPRSRPANLWNPGSTEGPMGRCVDDVALLLSVLARTDLADPLNRPIEVVAPVVPVDRPLRVAWSGDLGGLPFEPAVLDVVATVRPHLERLGWQVEEAEPVDLASCDHVFETLRSWGTAGRLGALGDRLDLVKGVLRAEYEAGLRLRGVDVDRAYRRLAEIRAATVGFFDRYDLLVAPVTQVEPFPLSVEYPTEVAGVAMGSYIEWMRSCSRITVLGCPALSLPAGAGPTGLPAGVQLVAAPGADAALLAMARALEIAIDHRPRRDTPWEHSTAAS